MSTRLAYGSIKVLISRVLSMNSTDPRVAEYCSRAQERLLHKAKWVGTYGRFRVCVQDSCLTWPREIETIEAAALCDVPMDIRNDWYEFLQAGPGVLTESCGPHLTLVDRGDAVAFDDVKGLNKKLLVYCDGTEATGLQILLRYYNASGLKVYSTVNGLSVEGEYVNLPAAGLPGQLAGDFVMPGGFYGCIKPATLRTVRIYEYDTVTTTQRPLAYYEPDETNPVYRRSLIPGISSGCCGGTSGACANSTVDIVGKFRTRDVAKDSDALIIQSREALRLMVQAIRKEEDNVFDDAARYEARAEAVLNEQLRHWMGDGKVAPMRIVNSDAGGGGVLNMI